MNGELKSHKEAYLVLVQNQKDLAVANKVYGSGTNTFGYAGRNDEYAIIWRKRIAENLPKRHKIDFMKHSIRGMIRKCRIADEMAKKEKVM